MKDETKPGALTQPLHPSSLILHPSTWRTFCAIELPQRVCDQANEHIRRLKDSFPNIRASWTRDDKFHLTLKFLGEISSERVASLSQAAERATVSSTPFKLIIEDAGAFPKSGPAKVLWLGVKDVEGGLADLHARLEEECANQGFAKEERSFHPHLTLARLRESPDARSLATLHKEIGFAGVEISVAELLAIRSELGSAGSKYTIISRHALRSSASEKFDA
jgi:2'-5' RNA ligase